LKSKEDITALVCRPHCRFYKPGEKEDLSCGGYDFFVERLSEDIAAEAARTLNAASALAEEARPPKRFEHNARIEAAVCTGCEFREEDCDFMGGQDIADAAPCGGYVLLARLLAAGLREAEDWLDERS
jgi:hypothetical protein